MHSLTCARKQGEETALEGWGELGARAVGGVVGRAGEGYASAQGIIAAGHSQGCAMLAAPHLCPGATKVLPSVPDKMFRRSGRQQLREEPEGVLTHALHPSLAAFGPPRRCRRAPTWLDQRAAMGPLHAPAPRKTCLRRHRVYPPPKFSRWLCTAKSTTGLRLLGDVFSLLRPGVWGHKRLRHVLERRRILNAKMLAYCVF